MKVLSLFSGVGGFDLGLENAGMQTVFQCEWDQHCRSVLDHHWANVPKWGDISTLTGKHILAYAPQIDVVAWGSPCQDLSVAAGSQRIGIQGARSGLFYEGIRIIKELRKETDGKYPRISIWENVAGALSSNRGADFEQILKEMVEAGAIFCEWRVLDAQYFGVPQRRRRVFVVAIFDSATAERCPDPLLPVSEGLRWNPKTGAATRQSSADTVTASIGSESGTLLIDGTRVNDVRVYEPPVQTLKHRMGTGGNNVPILAFDTQFGSNANVTEQISPTLKSSQQSPSVNFETAESVVIRRLTPIECERLMGWSDNHTLYKADGTTQADTQRYKQCGNGVTAPVAQWIGEQIMKVCNTLEG